MTVTNITLLLLFSVFYLLLTSVILIRNRFELTPLPVPKENEDIFTSILIPARNEEKHIQNCIQYACNQDYSQFEVIVLNDNSTDRTIEILEVLERKYPAKLSIINGVEKPAEWLGKPWACKQLADASNGEILLFIDADVTIHPETLSRINSAFRQYNLDMLTVWPRQILKTFWEQTIIPLVYYALVSLLPAIYTYRPPRWMPKFLAVKTRKYFSAACGQFLAFRRESYQLIGTHEAVKNRIVEDVALARLILKRGLRARMFEGFNTVSCRMYTDESEIRNGFRKNFFAGFGYNYLLFLIAAILHLVVFIFPFLIFPYSLLTDAPVWLFLSTVSIAVILLHRLILSIWFNWNPLYSLTHPLGVLWFQYLGIITLRDKFFKNKIVWKDRSL